MTRVIKRYANRKLYDTTTSRYVALDDIAALVRGGEDVEVTDNETGTDLTAVTFAQIILEEERRRSDFLSAPVLKQLVRYGGDALSQMTTRGIEALGEMRELAERRVSDLVAEKAPRPALLDDVLSGSRRRLETLQKQVDEGIKQSIDKLKSYPAIGPEIERLESRARAIEARIKTLLAGAVASNGAAEIGAASDDAGAPPAGAAIGGPGVDAEVEATAAAADVWTDQQPTPAAVRSAL